ncbi:MAG: flagellar hook-length control protein FliK [Betaproteobacteria bacterium]
MIPSDVASRLQVSADANLRPVAPAQEISDKLSGLVAGQKVMAEIQALLPNGTYRAMINQRNVTLALPFSAKSGDSLELLVTESDGKLALAVASRPAGETDKPSTPSTSATLSRTGQLISDLFSGPRDSKGGAVALPLKGNQPLANAPPTNAQDLVPLLKQAITQSGMFYESHQAEWIEGRFQKADLLQEPQGKLSSPAAFVTSNTEEQAHAARLTTPSVAGEQANSPAITRSAADPQLTQNPVSVSDSNKPVTTPLSAQQGGPVIAQQIQPVVQQQLEALATQNFSWQGQIWPGQEMRWEIDEDSARQEQNGDETATQWSTRLRMTLPNLGEIDAQIRLQNNRVTLAMSTGSAETRSLMRAASLTLRSQLDEAGITLASMGVDTIAPSTVDGQT